MDALARKAVQRHGKPGLRVLVHALRASGAKTTEDVRNVMRCVEIMLPDEVFETIRQEFAAVKSPEEPADQEAFDVDNFIFKGILGLLHPRRQAVLAVLLSKFPDCSASNLSHFIAFKDLAAMYDAMRHPEVLSGRMAPEDEVNTFLNHFEDACNDGITVEELMSFYASHYIFLPSDQDFELLIMRAYSLDRQRTQSQQSYDYFLKVQKAKQKQMNNAHPLYATTNADYGKDCEKPQYVGKNGRSHIFTKMAPVRSSGATGMNI